MTANGGKKPEITPDSKLSKVLESYPQLEDVLVAMSPSFAKLKNPLLRKTVAKVATLQQVANVGEIPVGELVNKLRAAVGIEAGSIDLETAPTDDPTPAWLNEAAVTIVIDADKMLDSGVHPLETIGTALKNLKDGEVVKLTASFMPDPLIAKFKDKGFLVWTRRLADGLVECFFARDE